MKKLTLFVILFLNGLFVFSQKADTITNKPGKIKNIDGTLMSPVKDIIENISSAPGFTLLANAIKAAGLTDTFKGGPITVFAPVNKAFEKLAPGKLDTLLLPAHNAELVSLLKYHTISGRILSKDIEKQIKAGNGQATFTTLSGGILTAHINANKNIVLIDEMGGESVISQFDIQQSNGVLHTVTGILIPKSK